MTLEEMFKIKTVTKKTKHGWECICLAGNWGVYASTKEEAEKEGYHYFVQYLQDDLIGLREELHSEH